MEQFPPVPGKFHFGINDARSSLPLGFPWRAHVPRYSPQAAAALAGRPYWATSLRTPASNDFALTPVFSFGGDVGFLKLLRSSPSVGAALVPEGKRRNQVCSGSCRRPQQRRNRDRTPVGAQSQHRRPARHRQYVNDRVGK
jgi:hypothetical protein